jgi:8-oxo-dGTP diphosphatase
MKGHALALKIFARLPQRGQTALVHAVAPTFSVGGLVVLTRDDGRVLLVRAAYRDAWGLPGGLLDRHEEPHETAVREAREEVGLRVVVTGEPIADVDVRLRKVDLIFPAVVADGVDPDSAAPQPPEIVECRWFGLDELPRLQPEATSGIMKLLPNR